MLPLILALAGLAAEGYGAYEKHKQNEAQDKYLDDQKAHNDFLEAQAKRENRRAALARAIGADTQFLPTEPPKEPMAPDLRGYETRAGLANLGSNALNDILAHPEWYQKLPGALPEDLGSWDMSGGYYA